MKNLLKVMALTLAMALPAASTQAGVVDLTNITGTWFDAVPSGNITSNNSPNINAQVRWGASGYNFDAGADVSVTLPPTPSPDFVLGDFTHVNFPIPAGTSITSIRLRVDADVSVDTVAQGTKSFIFDFTHEETPNDPPCLYGPPDLSGVNSAGCADRVTLSFSSGSDSFLVGSDLYTIDIVGFVTGGGAPASEFLTAESAENTAQLLAHVDLLSNVVVTPEPSSFVLLALGLAGLGWSRRKKA